MAHNEEQPPTHPCGCSVCRSACLSFGAGNNFYWSWRSPSSPRRRRPSSSKLNQKNKKSSVDSIHDRVEPLCRLYEIFGPTLRTVFFQPSRKKWALTYLYDNFMVIPPTTAGRGADKVALHSLVLEFFFFRVAGLRMKTFFFAEPFSDFAARFLPGSRWQPWTILGERRLDGRGLSHQRARGSSWLPEVSTSVWKRD